jgi:plasmid stabilization system protein ParE
LVDYSICADVSFRVIPEGVLASNYRARQHVLLNLPLFNALAGADPVSGEPCAWDRTSFSNVDGLLADPTCLRVDELGEPTRFATYEDAWRYLADRFVLIQDTAEYDALFAVKKSLVDRKHFGTFHQRLGAELRLNRRVDPDEWWYAQKFDPETGEVRDNLYKFVQQAFLEEYIGSLDLTGKRVLDFGCGAGMAARLFTAQGGLVTGVDPELAPLAHRISHRMGSLDHFYMVNEAKREFELLDGFDGRYVSPESTASPRRTLNRYEGTELRGLADRLTYRPTERDMPPSAFAARIQGLQPDPCSRA